MEDRKHSPIFEYDEIYEENVKMEEMKEVPRTPSIWIPTSG